MTPTTTNKYMKEIVNKLKTFGLLLWSKGAVIVALVLLAITYLRQATEESSPFIELIYMAVIIAAIAVSGVIFRFVVFNESAELAESGKIKEYIKLGTNSEALTQYRFATAISFAIPTICATGIL